MTLENLKKKSSHGNTHGNQHPGHQTVPGGAGIYVYSTLLVSY